MTRSIRRLLFRLLYRELAFTYDSVSRLVSLGHWARWQRSVIRYLGAPVEGPVLELAHGTGDLQLNLRRAGFHTVAIDLSAQMGRIANAKLRRAGLPAQLVRAKANRLPFEAASFPAIVCTFPTAFVAELQTLAEVRRVLSPSGRALVVLVGQLQGQGPLRLLLRGLYRLCGQRNGLLSDAEFADVFGSSGLAWRSEIVDCGGSVAQLLILTKTPSVARSAGDMRLDCAPKS